MIKAEIVADSLSPQGDRLTSVLVTMPRIILSEMNTHRMLSKNTSSSRAIPFKKMVEAVQNNPFIPIAWQKEHIGMQGTEYLTEKEDIEYAIGTWLHARDAAIQEAKIITSGASVTKQLANRLLEPFMWTTMLITGSREGWDNFFKLRNPVYETEIGVFKSKRDALISYAEGGVMANLPTTDLEWLQINKGQAEIHIIDLAEKIYDCIQESVPKQLKNEWHIPFEDKINELYPNLTLEDKIKVSVGMAANTSYTIVGDGSIITLEKATRIHDKCKELSHSSVFEHCARAMSDEEYECFLKGEREINKNANHWSDVEYFYDYDKIFGWCNNLKGFIPYRYLVDNKIDI